MMREKVIVVGGGIAGLTAAHELAERGFDVHVYERRHYLGGKAASLRSTNDLPTEHGFRFFPGWYKHVPDTLRRIPYRSEHDYYRNSSVLDNLVTVDAGLLAWTRRESVRAPMHVPRSVSQAATAWTFFEQLQSLGLGVGELGFFLSKLATFATMSEAERVQLLEPITWWQYVEAEQKSQAYRDLISVATRSMVAAKATEASAYTIARLALRTLADAFSSVDRVLNGPTSEVWLTPWRDHLLRLGVHFHHGFELESLAFADGEKKLASVSFSHVLSQDLRTLQTQLARLRTLEHEQDERALRLQAAEGRLHELDQRRLRNATLERERARQVLDSLLDKIQAGFHCPGLRDVLDKLRHPESLRDRDLAQLSERIAEAEQDPAIVGHPAELVAEADYFVFALPVEQMAYYVNRSTMLKHYDPSLTRVIALAEHTDWMAGIQFYLKVPVDLARGHIVCMDSEWSLTSIEHMQFWRDVSTIPDDVKAILSVDIAAWSKKGRQVQKEGFHCTRDEIAREVWAQLQAALNRDPQGKTRLRDDMLRGGPSLRSIGDDPNGNFYLDDSLVDLFDRKKQAYFEKARSVRADRSPGVKPRTSAPDIPYVYGARALYNLEPLLVNRVGVRELRPTATTEIRNLFLAADYVLTETDLACMEGANEAARLAVNGVLDAAGSHKSRCEIWRLSAGDELAARLRELTGPAAGLEVALGAARSLGKVAGGLLNVAGRMARASQRMGLKP